MKEQRKKNISFIKNFIEIFMNKMWFKAFTIEYIWFKFEFDYFIKLCFLFIIIFVVIWSDSGLRQGDKCGYCNKENNHMKASVDLFYYLCVVYAKWFTTLWEFINDLGLNRIESGKMWIIIHKLRNSNTSSI